MAQEDDPQGYQSGSSNASTDASSASKRAAHMASSSAPRGFIIGSSDPDSTAVYVQAAAESRKRAAHMDIQKGIELETDSIMDEIHGRGPASRGEGGSQAAGAPALQGRARSRQDDRTVPAAAVPSAGDTSAASRPGGAPHSVSSHTNDAGPISTGATGVDRSEHSDGGAGGEVEPPKPVVTARSSARAVGTDAVSATAGVTAGSSRRDDGPSRRGIRMGRRPRTAGSYDPDTTHNPYENDPTGKRKKRKRHVGVIVACVIVALLASGVAYGLWYLHDINSRLKDNLDSNFTSQLAKTEAQDPFYMLLLGTDKDEDRASGSEYGDSDSAYRSDSIMLVRIDPKNVKVTLVSIHRDTMVDLGEYGTQKINAAYSIGGPSYATQVIEDFAGVSISHYAEVDMDSFTSIVDQVDGVTVNLPIAVKDPDYTGLDLEAGEQTLDGHTAALLCRARHAYDNYGDGDRYRAANQRIVMMAIVKKVLASDAATQASTITTMADSVTTDMSVTDILSLAEQMKSLDVSKDVMSGMEPTTSEYINETWYELVDEDAWKEMMARVDQGLSPTEDNTDDAMTQDVAAGLADGDADSSTSTEEASASSSDDD